MGSYGRGLEYLNRQRESGAFPSGQKREWTNQLWLAEGDIAILRFVTDGDAVFVGQFHEEERTSRKGNKYRADVLCLDSGDPCKNCREGDNPWVKLVALVYVEAIDHRVGKPGWIEKPRGTVKFYREDVGDFRLWMIKSSMQRDFIDLHGMHGSVTDVYHELSRNTGKPVKYSLTRMDSKVPFSKRSTEAIVAARDIEELVLENFGPAPKRASAREITEQAAGFQGDPTDPGPKDEDFVRFDD